MKTAVLLSGGVDSALALSLLQEEGHSLHAFYIKVWLQDELSFLGDCPWEDDLRSAQAVCRKLGVSFDCISLQNEYWENVIDVSLKEIQAGKTPNPDILCNSLIKFKAFHKALKSLAVSNNDSANANDSNSNSNNDSFGTGYQSIASGHYARIEEQEENDDDDDTEKNASAIAGAGKRYLKTALDPIKDQSYFLAQLSAEQIRQCRFPLGSLLKEQVRQMAAERRLPNAGRAESQGLCFLGKMDFQQFIAFHLGHRRGKILASGSREVLGHHKGHWFYTIGQRQGLGLSNGPWYVSAKNVEENVIMVSRRGEETSRFIALAKPHWIYGLAPEAGADIRVKLRHSPESHACRVWHKKGASNACDTYGLELLHAKERAARGQYAVFYIDDICYGSAVIL